MSPVALRAYVDRKPGFGPQEWETLLLQRLYELGPELIHCLTGVTLPQVRGIGAITTGGVKLHHDLVVVVFRHRLQECSGRLVAVRVGGRLAVAMRGPYRVAGGRWLIFPPSDVVGDTFRQPAGG